MTVTLTHSAHCTGSAAAACWGERHVDHHAMQAGHVDAAARGQEEEALRAHLKAVIGTAIAYHRRANGPAQAEQEAKEAAKGLDGAQWLRQKRDGTAAAGAGPDSSSTILSSVVETWGRSWKSRVELCRRMSKDVEGCLVSNSERPPT